MRKKVVTLRAVKNINLSAEQQDAIMTGLVAVKIYIELIQSIGFELEITEDFEGEIVLH